MDEDTRIKVEGQCSFEVKLQPEYDHFTALTSLKLKALTSSKVPLTVSCVWKRSFGSRSYLLHSVQNK